MLKHFDLFVVLICVTLLSCSNTERPSINEDTAKTYNEKANALILHAFKEGESCDCLLEIPNESIIEVSKAERPSYDMKGKLMQMLDLKTQSSLDSLVAMSGNFKLDHALMEQHHIKMVTNAEILAVRLNNDVSIFKKCPQGVTIVNKPIFTHDFKKGILDYSHAFMCTRGPLLLMEFKDGTWREVEE